MQDPYRPRAIDPVLADLVAGVPAVLVVGPRAVGKTTSAARHAATTIRLDRPAEAAAFRADPDAALRGLPEPVLLDEWQVVPEVLGAVKRAVDVDPRPGRFLLTGSVRADLDSETWPGTGRLVRVTMLPMSVAEQRGGPWRSLIDAAASGEEPSSSEDPPDLRGYVELALAGGFPEPALRVAGGARTRWWESYVSQVVTRDAPLVDPGRDPDRIQRWFEAYVLNTAGVVDDRTLYEAAGVNRRTAAAYEQLMANLLLAAPLPAWTTNRLKRLVAMPKRMVVDAGLITGALRVDAGAVMADGDLLGRVIETFACTQLRVDVEAAASRPRLFHLRTQGGRREVDVVAELGGGRVVAFEVKASSHPSTADARHLAWLRDELGDRFVQGIVLHTGPRPFGLGDRLQAWPIASAWADTPA